MVVVPGVLCKRVPVAVPPISVGCWRDMTRPVDFVGVSACRHVPGFRDLVVDVT